MNKERYSMTITEIKAICYPVQEMNREKCGEDSFYCPKCPVYKNQKIIKEID